MLFFWTLRTAMAYPSHYHSWTFNLTETFRVFRIRISVLVRCNSAHCCGDSRTGSPASNV